MAVADEEPFQGFWNCLDYIPGSAIRGALAQSLLNAAGPEDPDFVGLFLEDPVLFRNGYLEHQGRRVAWGTEEDGGRGRGNWAGRAAVPKDLARQAAHLVVIRWPAAAEPAPAEQTPPGEGAAAVAPQWGWKGFPAGALFTRAVVPVPYPRTEGTEEGGCPFAPQSKDRRPGAKKTLYLSTAIHRKTGTAYPGLLFGIQALDPGQTFLAEVIGTPERLAVVEAHLDRLEGRVLVGAERSRGMGKVNLQLAPDEAGPDGRNPGPATAEAAPAEAVASFTRAVRAEFDRLAPWLAPGGGGPPPCVGREQRWGETQRVRDGCLYLCLGLASPLVLPDPWDLPERLSDPLGLGARLAELGATPVEADRLRLVCGRLRGCVVSGWNQAWGLPKPTRPGFKAGGWAVYCCPRPPEGAAGRWEAALGRLELEGLGDRRVEGFGEVVFLPSGQAETTAGGRGNEQQ